MTFATWITLTRLLGIPVLLYALNQPTTFWQGLACGVFLIAASTDWLDGYVARRFNQVTELGKFLDPLVDKLLVITPLLSLLALGKVPVVGVFLIIARELVVAGWRVNQATISGANLWGKVKTVVQIAAIAILIAPLPEPWHKIGLVFFWFAVALTLISGWIYLRPSPVQPTPTPMTAPEVSANLAEPEPLNLQTLGQNFALLQDLHAFKSGFLSRVSHELRAPLNGIIGTHQLILSDLCDSPEEEREFLQHANQSIMSFLGILDTILKVAKVEAGKTPLNFRALSTLDLLQDIEDLMTVQGIDSNIPLTVERPEQDCNIWGDEPCLRQLLLNAISELMQSIQRSSNRSGRIHLSALPLPTSRQVQLQIKAQLPFQTWSEAIDTLEMLRSQESLVNEEKIRQPAMVLSPEFRVWLDYTLIEQMHGSFTYFEPEPGWTGILFTVELA